VRPRSLAGIVATAIAAGAPVHANPPAVLQRACAACHRADFASGGLSVDSREALLKGGASGPAIVPGGAATSLLVTRLVDAPGKPRMPPPPVAALGEKDKAALREWVDQGAPWAESAAVVDYVKAIAPIFADNCVRCHGPGRREKGLRLDTRTGALRGGLAGPVVEPGKAAASALVKRLTGEAAPRMPYQEPPLPAEQIARVRAWIDAGAPGPDDRGSAGDGAHWSYVKPVRPEPPPVKAKGWVKNPIDLFVLARLEQEGLSPSPEAGREALLRRVWLDLVGLPPTLPELDAFLADKSPDAYEKAVDRLLASPHYGERWARPWLDLARYADTNGYEKDRRRAAWKWRDWVIAALNADMPFRQFTIEQIAGDMLDGATQDQRIATGFHRNTLLNQEGGIDVEEARWETLVDRVNTTATVWLGTTLGCAQCHDHKFDPFTQKDYYRMLAFFDNGEYRVSSEGPRVVDKWIVEPELELPTPEQAARKRSLEDELQRAQARLAATSAELGANAPELDAERARLRELRKELADLAIPTAMVLRERGSGGWPSTPLRARGSFMSPGERVFAAVPGTLQPLPPAAMSNRLGLAQWLADENNPLTPRVAVNRIWEKYFGRGLVLTSEDFGSQGERPSHPELLDWLATEFLRLGTRQKPLHRLIVTSAAYRQASRVTPALRERDPDNRLLARGPRLRVEAETVRDIALQASGLLDPALGGPSVFPFQPEGIWDNPYSDDKWKTSEGGDRYRRALYTFARRTAPYPSLTVFDAPSREFCTARRVRTNTPLQALTTLNDPFFVEAARALATRTLREAGPSAEARASHAFRLCTARRPEPAELAQVLAFQRQQWARLRPAPEAELEAWTRVANVLLNLDETVTKQ
jgi:mono/diheme cytochrome c family protein